jgi:cytochrome bd ubiquinol oxidase subunit II
MNAEMLPLIWMFFLAASIVLYTLLDGFSLGIGILFPFAPSDKDRQLMMGSVSPVWDGNQTWLVGGGAALFAAFPKAFNLLLSALYLPLIFMLIALVFRGVAFEFYMKAKDKALWNLAFIGGSTVAAFMQGLVLGTYVLGFEYDGSKLVVGPLHFLSAFSVMTGIGVVLAYALSAACWLLFKTEGELRDWTRRRAQQLLPLVVGMIALVCIWTPAVVPEIRALWFGWPNLILLSPVPLWITVLALATFAALRRPDLPDLVPFLCCIGLYLITFIGLAVSLWPYVVPRVLTLWQVAAPANSLLFTMVGVLLIVPIVLVYTAHAYYVFRGKVSAGDAYH